MSKYQQYVNELILKGFKLHNARTLANRQLVQEEMQNRWILVVNSLRGNQMLFRRTSPKDLEIALNATNLRYGGNLRLADVRAQGSATRACLRVHNGRAHGARTVGCFTTRHGPYASWEAHRDFLRVLFATHPEAKVVTGLAQRAGIASYTAENFEAVFPATADVNVGSQIAPMSMRDCTIDAPMEFSEPLVKAAERVYGFNLGDSSV